MSEKAKKIADLLDRIGPGDWKPPSDAIARESGFNLLQLGLFSTLTRVLSDTQAEKTVRNLAGAYPDWNELRVSQIQEFEQLVDSKNGEQRSRAANAVREYLQEVFQKNHGFDLEFLRADLNEAGRFVAQLPFLGSNASHWLLWHATAGQVPVSPSIVRILDRLGLIKRTSSMQKAQELLENHVPSEIRAEFAARFGQVIDRWCRAKDPICWECVLVEVCPHGRKVQREWKVQQRRLLQQRKRDEERERKEAEKRRKDEERARKRAEAEQKRRAAESARAVKRRARENERRRREDERRRQAEKRAVEKAALEQAQRDTRQKKAEQKKALAAKKGAKKSGGKASAPKKKAAAVLKKGTRKHS